MKKFIVIFLCFYAAAFGAWFFLHKPPPAPVKTAEAAPQSTPKPEAPVTLTRLLDADGVDGMAGRMKTHQDVYKKLRDESLKVYANSHPSGKYDKLNAVQIRLAAYLWVWDDFYGEGLWQIFDDNANQESQDPAAPQDPLLSCMESISCYPNG